MTEKIAITLIHAWMEFKFINISCFKVVQGYA